MTPIYTSLADTHKSILLFFFNASLSSQTCPDEVYMGDPNFQRATTKLISDRVKTCAHTLRQSSLLTKLATYDMLFYGAVYHLPCLTTL